MHAAARKQRHVRLAHEPGDGFRRVAGIGILGNEDDERPIQLFVQRRQQERQRRLGHAGRGRERLGKGAQPIALAELPDERMQDRGMVHSERPNPADSALRS